MDEKEVDDGRGPHDLVPPDPVDRAIALLRMDVPVDERAFDARVLAAIRREANTSAFRLPRRMLRGALWGGAAAVAASIAVLAMIQLNGLHGRGHAPALASPASVTHVGNGTNAVTAVAMRSGSHPVQFVRFSLTGARATNVTVAGTFNGWNASATPLRQVDSMTWVADVPLKAGRYTYQFVLDNRKWVPDPHAPRDPGDDFGTGNSVVTVTGESGS